MRALLKRRPGLTASQVAEMWGTTRQNIWNIADRQGIRMAIRGRTRAEGV